MEEESTTETRWEQDERLLRLSQEALFNNRIDEAEKLLIEGMEKPKNSDGLSRDLRGGFALIHALISLMKGLASLEKGLLEECVNRLKNAESLAKSEGKWIGRTVIVSICVLLRGIILCAQKKFVSGVYKIMWALPGIKTLQKDGLDYDGMERPLVRSASLLVAGLFTFIFGIVPARYKNISSYVTPFEGDRVKSTEYFRICFEENGFLAPFAGLALCALTVDTKTFFGEEILPEDIETANELFHWQDVNFPNSVFFVAPHADFYAVQRDTVKATEYLLKRKEDMEKFNVMKWVYRYKLASLKLCDADWDGARVLLEEGAKVYLDANKLNFIPFSSALAMTLNLQCQRLEKAKEFSEKVMKCRNEAPKGKKWGPQDTYGLNLWEKYFKDGELETLSEENPSYWPLIDILEFIIIRARITYWMNEAQLLKMIDIVETEYSARVEQNMITADERIRYNSVVMNMLFHMGNFEEAMERYEKGLEDAGSLTKTKKGALNGTGNGTLPYMHLMAATIAYRTNNPAVREYLKRLEKEGKDYTYYGSINVKNIILQKALGLEVESAAFQNLNISAGKAATLSVPVTSTSKFDSVSWHWVCSDYDIEFEVVYEHENGKTTIKDKTRSAVGSGQVSLAELQIRQGMLHLSWSNKFSYFRKKSLKYLVTPSEHGELYFV